MIRSALLLLVIAVSQVTTVYADQKADDIPVNVGVLLLDNDEYGPERQNSFYHLVVGSLQVAFKRADLQVHRVRVPMGQHPEDLEASSAVTSAARALDNPSLDTLVLVDAVTTPVVGSADQQLQLQLRWQLYDMRTHSVFATQEIATQVVVRSGCEARCFDNLLSRHYVSLALGQSQLAIRDIRAHHAHQAQLASRHTPRTHLDG